MLRGDHVTLRKQRVLSTTPILPIQLSEQTRAFLPTWCLSAYCLKGNDCSIQLPSTPEPCSTIMTGSLAVL